MGGAEVWATQKDGKLLRYIYIFSNFGKTKKSSRKEENKFRTELGGKSWDIDIIGAQISVSCCMQWYSSTARQSKTTFGTY